MRVIYATDLYGDRNRYDQLLRLVQTRRAGALILGGNLGPTDHVPLYELAIQHDFLQTILIPWRQRLYKTRPGCAVYILPGQRDWAEPTQVFTEYAEGQHFYPLHQRAWRLTKGIWLAGNSLVPCSQQAPRDWERLEGVDPEPPFPRSGGLWSGGGGLRVIGLDDVQAQPTIADELAWLATQSDPSHTIYIVRSPPYATALDRLPDQPPQGSRAIRSFIEGFQPLVTLHGAVLDPGMLEPYVTDTIGRTLCIAVAQHLGRRSALMFNTDNPHETLHLV